MVDSAGPGGHLLWEAWRSGALIQPTHLPLGGALAVPLPSLGLRLLICKQEIRTSSGGVWR